MITLIYAGIFAAGYALGKNWLTTPIAWLKAQAVALWVKYVTKETKP
jgi:hypothetical protein